MRLNFRIFLIALIAILILPPLVVQADAWSDAKKAAKSASKNPDVEIREAAVRGLEDFEEKEVVDLLLDLMAMSSLMTRQHQDEKIRKINKADNMEIKKILEGGAKGHKDDMVSLTPEQSEEKAEYDKLNLDIKKLEDKITKEEKIKTAIRMKLGRLNSEDAVKKLIREVGKNKDWQVRAAAAEALGASPTEDVREALVKALKKEKDPRAKLSIIESIGFVKASDALEELGELVEDGDNWQLKIEAAKAIKYIGDPKGIGYLIEGLKEATGRVKDEINSLIVKMTGVDKKGDYNTWKLWWDQNKESLAGGGYERPKQVDSGGGAGGDATTFYGIPVVSKRVVFILDRSGSMSEPAGWKPEKTTASGGGGQDADDGPIGDRKIDVAKHELKNAIRGLAEDVRFNVIFYNHEYTIWMDDDLQDATEDNKKKAIRFVDELEPSGQTNIFDPLEKGFLLRDPKALAKAKGDEALAAFNGGVDTIYLLSDGMPNNGRIQEPEAIIAKVAEMNRVRKIIINTVAVGKNLRLDFMQRLAGDNGGTCVHRE